MTLSQAFATVQAMKNKKPTTNSRGEPNRCYPLSTVQVLLKSGPLADLVEAVAREQKVDLWRVRTATDLVAVGSLVAIVDPTLVGPKSWRELCGWLAEMDDPHTKVLIVAPSPHSEKLPAKNVVRTRSKIDRTFLKLLLVHLRSTFERRRRVFEKKERQIVRLMFMLARLDRNEPLKVREVAQEFRVTHRTIQRDLELLLMAGYPVVESGEPGQYRFVENFKSYQRFFG